MRTIAIATTALTLALLAGCSQNPSEIGFIIGEPSGVSYVTQIESGDTLTFQAGATGKGGLLVTADWLLGKESAHDVMDTGWMFYWGLGVRVTTGAVGPRVPLGLTYNFAPQWNALLIAEIAPGFALGKNNGSTFDWGIGIRWPF